jgi:hypothetical protein
MANRLGDTLARLSEDELFEWSAGVMFEITDEHVKALEVGGWKIVRADGNRWPFDSEETGCSCPELVRRSLAKEADGQKTEWKCPRLTTVYLY